MYSYGTANSYGGSSHEELKVLEKNIICTSMSKGQKLNFLHFSIKCRQCGFIMAKTLAKYTPKPSSYPHSAKPLLFLFIWSSAFRVNA